MCQCIDTGIDNEGERTDPAYIDLDADHSYTCRRLSSTPLQRQPLSSTLWFVNVLKLCVIHIFYCPSYS